MGPEFRSSLISHLHLPPPLFFLSLIYFELKDNYSFVLFFAIHQHGSVIGIHMSPPSRASLPPPTLTFKKYRFYLVSSGLHCGMQTLR